ncbi:hypothetical protein [Victivallis vadensis]
MKVTPIIVKAIESAIAACDSQRDFAAKAGILPASLSKYLSGKNKIIRDDNWNRLFPLLEPYLPTIETQGSNSAVLSKTNTETIVFADTEEKITEIDKDSDEFTVSIEGNEYPKIQISFSQTDFSYWKKLHPLVKARILKKAQQSFNELFKKCLVTNNILNRSDFSQFLQEGEKR